MLLPLEPVLDAELLEQVLDVRVGAEEDVQARLVRVAVGIAPGGDLAAQEVAPLEEDGNVAGVGDVLGRGEAREAFFCFWFGEEAEVGVEEEEERGERRRAKKKRNEKKLANFADSK